MYLIVFLLSMFISLKLFKKACGTISFLRLNMMSWILYYDLILMSCIGSLLVVYNIDNHYMIDKLSYNESRIIGFFAINYTLLLFPVGMLLANRIFRVKKSKLLFDQYSYKPIVQEKNDPYVYYVLVAFSMVCIASVFYVLYTIKEIPLLSMFSKNRVAQDFAEFRIEASRDFQGNEYVKNVLAYTLTPILSFIALAYYKVNQSKLNLLWFIVLFLSSILILTYSYAKSPVIYYSLGFMFFYVYYKGTLSKKLFLFFILVSFVMIIGVYLKLMDDNPEILDLLVNYNSGITGRVLLSQCAGTFLSFDIFPNFIEHLNFESFSRLISDILGTEYTDRSARLLMESINPKGVQNGTAGVANSLFIAEAWANFGFIGVVFSPIYVGFLIQSLYIFFLKNKKTPLFIGIFISFSYRGSITGGINDYIYNPNTFLILIFVMLVLFLGKFYFQLFNYKKDIL